MNCPCGSSKSLEQCCGPYISGVKAAPTPETLMRSRYTAYTQANSDYIGKSQHGPAAKGYDPTASQSWAQQVQWQGLQIFASEQQDNIGFVAFRADFTLNGQAQHIFEKSEFRRIDGQWLYFDAVKIARNDPCPCGSGKKYKKCCME
jgi:SEC-C motif-containing protein